MHSNPQRLRLRLLAAAVNLCFFFPNILVCIKGRTRIKVQSDLFKVFQDTLKVLSKISECDSWRVTFGFLQQKQGMIFSGFNTVKNDYSPSYRQTCNSLNRGHLRLHLQSLTGSAFLEYLVYLRASIFVNEG